MKGYIYWIWLVNGAEQLIESESKDILQSVKIGQCEFLLGNTISIGKETIN